MTSPASQIAETFTGSNGDAWANFNTHYTQTGTFSTGPTEDIQSNKGRASATTSAASTVRRHRTSGFQLWLRDSPFQNQATFVRSSLTVKPALHCLHGPTDSTANYIYAQAETFSGKSTTYGLAIKKRVSGTVTTLMTLSSVSGASATATTMGIALRTWYLANGNLLIQAKLWDNSGGEPAWVWPTSDVSGSTASGTGAIAYVMSSADRAADYASSGFYGMLEEGTATSTAYTVDWDNTAAYYYDASATISTGWGSLAATAVAGSEKYWNTATNKGNRFGNGALTGTGPGVHSWWSTSGTAWTMLANTDYITSSDGTSQMSYDTTNTVHSLALPGLFACGTVSGGAVAGTTPRYIIRYKDASNYVFVAFDATSDRYRLMKRVAGVETVVDADIGIQGAFGFSTFLKLSASGTTFRVVHLNLAGTLVARTYTISDADLQTGTEVRVSAGGDASFYMTAVRVGIGSSINRTDLGTVTATSTATVTSGSSPQSISLAPSTVTTEPQAYGLSLTRSTDLAPSSVTVSPQTYSSVGVTSIVLGASSITVTGSAPGRLAESTVGLSNASVAAVAAALSDVSAASRALGTVSVTVDPLSFGSPVYMSLTPAEIQALGSVLTLTISGAVLPMGPSVLTLVPSVLTKLVWPPGGGFVTVTFSPLEEGSIGYSFPESGDTITVSISRSS